MSTSRPRWGLAGTKVRPLPQLDGTKKAAQRRLAAWLAKTR